MNNKANPSVGIFWYDFASHSLFGVRKQEVMSAQIEVAACDGLPFIIYPVVPILRHLTKEESFVVIRGNVKVTTYNDDGSVIESVVLWREGGCYGVDMAKNVEYNLERMDSDLVFFGRRGRGSMRWK